MLLGCSSLALDFSTAVMFSSRSSVVVSSARPKYKLLSRRRHNLRQAKFTNGHGLREIFIAYRRNNRDRDFAISDGASMTLTGGQLKSGPGVRRMAGKYRYAV